MQKCCVDGCDKDGAFRTRTRPTWCHEHLALVYREAGVELLQNFTKTTEWLLTRCLTCDFQAHYRFDYVQRCLGREEHVCRSCFWKTWAVTARASANAADPTWAEQFSTPVDPVVARAKAEANGYRYLRPLTNPSREGDPHAVECTACGSISAERLGDIGWGCDCRKSAKTATVGTLKTLGHNLLKNSNNLAKTWWDHDLNSDSAWETAKLRSPKIAWWSCDKGHTFEAKILDMSNNSSHCPDCYRIKQEESDNYAAQFEGLTIADVPELNIAWAEDIPPSLVSVIDGTQWSRYRFRCPKGHTSSKTPLMWLTSECSACRGLETRAANKRKAQEDPDFSRLTPEISSQWHPIKNGKWALAEVSPESRRMAWWRDPVCGHDFEATPRERDKYDRWRCPECRTILDSLAYHYPEIAAQWADNNHTTPWHIRPTTTRLTEVPTWVCPDNPEHRWQAMPGSRVGGSGCPMCQPIGKSRIELVYADAAREQWIAVDSGKRVFSSLFRNHSSWSVDILVALPDDRLLAIEYDGSYWHRDKQGVDEEKTRDLLRAGYLVCRLREDPLPPLEIEDEGYLELVVYSTAQTPADTIQKIADSVQSHL